MTVSLRAYNVSLELPTEVHKTGRKGYSDLLATISGAVRYQSTILSGINFAAADGDRIGVMGLNGAGKTTLLRVLNGAYPPTAGVIRAEGTRQSLLSPLLGFSEFASVAENIFLRGTAMGLRYRQLKVAAPEILEFAGLTDRAEYPLYSLSSGQRMRLGFSISTAVQPDILLMDEWLSTGDASFVQRARKRMTDRFEGSRIVVLASHSTGLLRNTCNKALVLDKGKMRFFGEIAEGLEVYREMISLASADVRDAAAGDDPILFGSTTGVVERIRAAGGVLEVSGWAMDERGKEPAVVCLEFAGEKHLIETFERVQRDDVSSYLGKASGKYGFRVSLPLLEAADPAHLVENLRVSVGKNTSRLSPPLPLVRASVVETD
ncbi:ABC transporter ATP-binding protein [Pseudoxanthomonas sp. PXM03]|uniref:ABC transporter ATP-binding protein n=1 Tax=Pseudoxanthomonas sp. PXM03 TaxID=2769284 RepID=UPI00178375AE|nr:ATP-binding cassette domain-containing protein [Pseudoxanthomonas sp. PXM03]MBD9436744.1 ABC transporter ATP-binding protein [Pseudoxanthomonas sp. PXM03]